MQYENKGEVVVTSESPTNIIGTDKGEDFLGFRQLCDIEQPGYLTSLRMVGKNGAEAVTLNFNQKFGSVSLFSNQLSLEPGSVFRVTTQIFCTEVFPYSVKLIANILAFVDDAIALNDTVEETTFSTTDDKDSNWMDALAIMCNLSQAGTGYSVTFNHVGMG